MRKLWLLVSLALLASSCGGGGTTNPRDAEPEPDTQKVDTGVDGTGMEDTDVPDDTEEDADSCVPKTPDQCGPMQCGEIEDGCGGTIDCGTCPCADGAVQVSQCGTCGLGVRQCGDDETGQGTCEGPSIPGLDASADDETCSQKLVFVDGSVGSSGDGSRENPFKTYKEAADEATTGQTIVLGGAANYRERLTVKKGVTVIGGFTASPDFEYQKDRKSVFSVDGAGSDGKLLGAKAVDITQETVVSRVEIRTEDATKKGMTNYGFYARNASGLVLRDVKAKAGKGGPGKDGSDGSNGSDGKNGKTNDRKANPPVGKDKNGNLTVLLGAAGGKNPECPKANGGEGGHGSLKVLGTSSGTQRGKDSTEGASGGSAATGSLNSDGGAGSDGQDGQDGQSGAAGESKGEVKGGFWHPLGDGSNGKNGGVGAGGGGGGGAWHGSVCQRLENGTPGAWWPGPGGGGGGAGGCGGIGGKGGESGGGSFGLFVVESNLTLENSTFKADFGGNGGDAGKGGAGGAGGSGGRGTNESRSEAIGKDFCDGSTENLSHGSGNGGRGGAGGDGGPGGGGAGGMSVGAFCYKSTPTVTEADFEAGGRARGGNSSGEVGADGRSLDEKGCQ